MSYAGPVSRAKRAPGVEPIRSAPSFKAGRKTLPARAQKDPDHRPMVVLAAGIAIGLVVGAGVALLFAPEAGEDTRRLLRRRGRQLGQRGHDAWDDLRIEFQRALRRRRMARSRPPEPDAEVAE